jgi:UDP-glucose 4-epimerase
MSTFHVYGFPQADIITEDTLPSPVSHYAISHYVAERYCHQFFIKNALYYNVLRISNGYGAPLFKEIDRWSLVLNDFCKSAATKSELLLKTKGTQKRDFVSLNDISGALKVLIDNPQTEYKLFNVGGENSKSIRELADMVIDICKKDFNQDIKLKFADHLLDATVQKNVSFDISRIKAMGFSPQADMEKEIQKLIKMCHEFKIN